MRAGQPGMSREAAAGGSETEWSAERISFRYPGSARFAVQEVSFTVPRGACTAILGPNGSGKSTLLRLLLRSLDPLEGAIQFDGRALTGWARSDLARTIGVVPQHEQVAFPISVREFVAMGRYPHLGLLRAEGAADRTAVLDALIRCDVAEFQHRQFDTLSGGERQRVRLARALAQQPRVLALDEPTLALDLRHEMEIFVLLRGLVATGATVILVTHNLNLASRFADRLALMSEGRLVAAGTPTEVLERGRLEQVFGWPLRTLEHPGPGPDTGAIQITPLTGEANPSPGSPENTDHTR